MTQPSWAGQALDRLAREGGSDPHLPAPDFEALRASAQAVVSRIAELGDVTEIRLVADHDLPGGIYVLVLGTSSAPLMSWRIAPEFVDELQHPGSDAMIRGRIGQPAASLVTPPGVMPSFFKTGPGRLPADQG